MKMLVERVTNMRTMLERESLAYRYLMETGYSEDIEFCIQRDTTSTVPVLSSDNRIR